MKPIIIIALSVLAFYLFWRYILHPKQSNKLLKTSISDGENLDGFIKKEIIDKPMSEENAMVLASLIVKYSLSSLIFDYHRKRSRALSELFSLQEDSYKQGSVIHKIKSFILDESKKYPKMYSLHTNEIVEKARLKCNQLISPSASKYGA